MSKVKVLRKRFTFCSLFLFLSLFSTLCYNNRFWLLLVLFRMNKLLASVFNTEIHCTQLFFFLEIIECMNEMMCNSMSNAFGR